MQPATQNSLLSAFVFAVATSVFAADPWDAGNWKSYSDPWLPPSPYGPYSSSPAGTAGMNQLSPFDVFRPPVGTAPSRPGTMLQPWTSKLTPGARETKVPSSSESYQLDLTGRWRGSAGERVEIRGNRARIWGNGQQSCECIFMIHGNRMIAYSPDTDIVKKFEYSGGLDHFLLRDEQGGVMSFMRVR